tara:strand:- start:978 stop:1340 length:363 start_codon:yes stop_codon:yes gene_type:complete
MTETADQQPAHPITQREYHNVRHGYAEELKFFHLEAALISDWWNPTDKDRFQWRYILTLDIDGWLMRNFLYSLGTHQGRRVDIFYLRTLSEAWPDKPDHKNSDIRARLEIRYNKWGVRYD